MHWTDSEGGGVDGCEREDDVGQAGRVDLRWPDLVAGSTARVPGERYWDLCSRMTCNDLPALVVSDTARRGTATFAT